MKRTTQMVMIGALVLSVAGCYSSARKDSARYDRSGDRTARAADRTPRQEPTMGTHTDASGNFATRDERMTTRDDRIAATPSAGSENTPIAMAVRERLVQEGTVESSRVRVQDDRGTIWLNGTVDSASQKQRAEQVAMGTPGVGQVINQLQIGSAAGAMAPSAYDDRRAAADGSRNCTLVARIPGAKSDPGFQSVQLRVYEDLGRMPTGSAETAQRYREERSQAVRDPATGRVY
ncbi:MAG TPA: BON domain-containing protein, partial [Nitrospirales bacterium]|nr:BON domain-containing protein [Nitrospirales bacterium]